MTAFVGVWYSEIVQGFEQDRLNNVGSSVMTIWMTLHFLFTYIKITITVITIILIIMKALWFLQSEQFNKFLTPTSCNKCPSTYWV